jgi:hypothetical protein
MRNAESDVAGWANRTPIRTGLCKRINGPSYVHVKQILQAILRRSQWQVLERDVLATLKKIPTMSKFKNVILLYLFSEALYSSSQSQNEIQFGVFTFPVKLYFK